MKKIILLLLAGLSIKFLPAQPNPKVDSVVQRIRKFFNEKSPDSLYSLTGAAFKESISAGQFTSIAQNNLFPLGNMPAPKFISAGGATSKYKIDFASASIGMYVSLDSTGKLKNFLFKPYENEARRASKMATTNALATLPDKQVDAAVQPYIGLAATAGVSIGVIKDGKISYYHYGETEKGKGMLPTEHTLYEIGSITKTFTALLLADAVTRGRLKLDDPVNKYLPASVPKRVYEGVPVTLKMLANHTSGLPRMPGNFAAAAKDEHDPYKEYGSEQLLRFYKTFRLTKKPGTAYEYSNLGAATLGWILERTMKKPFEQLVKETITAPLGMKETKQAITGNDSARVAKGYDTKGAYNGPWNFKAFAPAGALRSTAADMLMYARAMMEATPAVLKNAIRLTQAITFTNGTTKVGLGWHYIKPGTNEVLFHNGGTGGFSSYLAIDKSKLLAVVVLSNTGLGVDEVGNKLMRELAE